jgi:superfamily II DNA or RNA helicase
MFRTKKNKSLSEQSISKDKDKDKNKEINKTKKNINIHKPTRGSKRVNENIDLSENISGDKQSVEDILKNNKELEKYIPRENKDIIHPKYWEIPNRKRFYNWVMDELGQYEIGNKKKQKPHEPRLKQHFELSNIQRLTRDYLQGESPVRGLLLYIGLGVGKTCTAITISEAILTKKEVIVISKSALEPTWIKDIKNCGTEYVRNQNYWIFKSCDTEEMKTFSTLLNIPIGVIKINGGVFLIDFTKKDSNFNSLNNTEREKLDLQIETIINNRFNFIHYDDTHNLWKKLIPGAMDNKIVIIDEVHNIGSRMAGHAEGGKLWYDRFMNAKNVKLIFLSATPIINRVFEITKIYNILRGYMHVLEIKFKSNIDTNINYDKIISLLKKNKHVDQIIKNKAKRIIKITKNPDNFITKFIGDGNTREIGLQYNPDEAIGMDEFRNEITAFIGKQGYRAVCEWQTSPATVFPEDEEDFEKLFYNRELNKLKRTDIIKRRISGLTSYYEYQDKSNYPQLLPINIIPIAMSEYQCSKYETYRHKEIEKEKFMKRKNADEEELPSSYRLASRMACSFVFPAEIGSPYDNITDEDNIENLENLQERLSNFNIRPTDAENMKIKEVKNKIKEGYLMLLEKEKAKYLDMKNGSLEKLSPKYYNVILRVQKQHPIGKILIYTQFLTLIGLNTFSLALQQTGSWAPFKLKKVNKQWEMDLTEEDRGKNLYIFYTGNEDTETRDIYIKIFNSEWNNLPTTCEKLIRQLKNIHSNNYYGEIIKMIMTTRTGAEGIDLHEIRFIHALEPYWQPVLIQQLIGRGVRNKSHLKLAPEDRNVEVFIYMATIPPNLVRKISYVDVRNDIYKYPNPAIADKVNKVVSSDEYLYLTSERKKYIVNEFQKLMKESAFDCVLNYKENKLNPDNKSLVCMDYNTKNRDDYIDTPNIEDSIEGYEISQDKIVAIQYKEIKTKDGKKYYYKVEPDATGKMYIYGEDLINRNRLPKPVGEVKIINGVRKFLFKKKK